MKIALFDPSKYFRKLFMSSIEASSSITWYEFDDLTSHSEAALEDRVDLIITAKELITSDYRDVTRFVKHRSKNNDIPIFLLSSDETNEFYDAAFNIGVTDIFSKQQLPLVVDMFKNIVDLNTSAIGAKVLIVEDDNSIANYYKHELSSLGFIVYLANSCESAELILQKHAIELLITDLYLDSGGHGQRIIRSIRHNKTINESGIPIMVISGSNLAQHQTGLFYLGIDDYLLKPVAPRQVFIRSVHLIKKYRSEKAAQEKAQKFKKMAHFDELTGAYNRHGFLHLAHFYTASCKRQKTVLGIVYIDLDHFKSVNDTHGHAVGDSVLKITVDILKHQLREQDIVSRWGGDELVILLQNCDEAFLVDVALRIQKKIIEQKEQLRGVGCSMGLSHGSPQSVEALLTLITQADEALYKSKKTAKGSISVYCDDDSDLSSDYHYRESVSDRKKVSNSSGFH